MPGRRPDRAPLVGDADAVLGCFENLSVVVGAFEGPEHIVVAVNSAARELLGHREVLGKPAAVGIPELVSQEYLELLDRTLETGEPFVASGWRNQLYAQAGAETEMYMDMELTPWRWPDGSIRGVITQVIDVTQKVKQHQAQQARADEFEERYLTTRDIVSTLQTTLLPAHLPVFPQARTAARYLVAAEEQDAGGDWFDTQALDDGRVALTVGDVVGHGVDASAVMGQLRAVLVELLASGTDLLSTLARLDSYATRQGSSFAGTVCVALLEPSTGHLEYGSCGHPLPLVVGPDGGTRFLPGTKGGPLRSGIRPQVGEAALGVRDLLLMYTDGLVERPGMTLQAGLDRLARVASAAMRNQLFPVGASTSTPHRVCGQTLEMMTRTGHLDDVTVLAVERREDSVPPLCLQVSADPRSLGMARGRVREWLEDLEVDAEDAMSLQLATTEVLSNSIEHGYRDVTPRPITLTLSLEADGTVRCTAQDQGIWQEPTAAAEDDDRQRGLALVSRLSDDMWVQHPVDGTLVTFTLRLRTRPTVASTGSPGLSEPRDPSDEVAFSVVEMSEPCPHLRVRGPVDLSTAPELDAALRRAARGGTIDVAIDLDQVTILASAGVQVLLDVSRLLDRHARTLRVVAAAGCPAYDVLAITGLPAQESLG